MVALGHSGCGAVQATIEELQRPRPAQSPNLQQIVDRVRPAVEALIDTELAQHPDSLLRAAVRANIRMSASQLRHGSRVLEQLIERGGLRVVGAEYSLDTGLVDFFDGTVD